MHGPLAVVGVLRHGGEFIETTVDPSLMEEESNDDCEACVVYAALSKSHAMQTTDCMNSRYLFV